MLLVDRLVGRGVQAAPGGHVAGSRRRSRPPRARSRGCRCRPRGAPGSPPPRRRRTARRSSGPRSRGSTSSRRPRSPAPSGAAPRLDELGPDGERVDEAGAGGRDVEAPGLRAAPILSCTRQAVAGKSMSGVTVATMMRSSSSGADAAPAQRILAAASAAIVARGRARLHDVPLLDARCGSGSTRPWCRRSSRGRRSSPPAPGRSVPRAVIAARLWLITALVLRPARVRWPSRGIADPAIRSIPAEGVKRPPRLADAGPPAVC